MPTLKKPTSVIWSNSLKFLFQLVKIFVFNKTLDKPEQKTKQKKAPHCGALI